jgi:uncharacterized protein
MIRGTAFMDASDRDEVAAACGSGFPGQREFKLLIVNGILSTMGNKPYCQVDKK